MSELAQSQRTIAAGCLHNGVSILLSSPSLHDTCAITVAPCGAAASALVHPSMSVALPALKFFLGQDEMAEAGDDSGDEADGAAGGTTVAAPTRAEIYKATSKVRCMHKFCLCAGV